MHRVKPNVVRKGVRRWKLAQAMMTQRYWWKKDREQSSMGGFPLILKPVDAVAVVDDD